MKIQSPFNTVSSTCPHREAFRFAGALAQAAQDIIVEKYHGPNLVSIKADRSLVTSIDQAVEKKLRELSRAKGYGFIGEEGGSENTDAEYVVIVDPIDGTNHLITRDDDFFTLIGVHHKKDGFVIGIVDQPATPHMWSGLRGHGAHEHVKDSAGNIVQTHALGGSSVKQMHDAILASWNPLSPKGADQYFYEDLRGMAKAEVPGCDAGNYARIASGRIHTVLDGGPLRLWDVAAHIPLIQETSGQILRLDPQGTTAPITLEDAESKMVVLATATPALMHQLLEIRQANFGRYKTLEKNIADLKAAHPAITPRPPKP